VVLDIVLDEGVLNRRNGIAVRFGLPGLGI
jgi:hypothetical protein